MPNKKENHTKNMKKMRESLKDARSRIDEALRYLDEDDSEEYDNDTGYGFIGEDGIERVSDEENYEALEEDDDSCK